MKKVIAYLFLLLALILLGYFRDYFLSQYNNYLYQLYYKDPEYAIEASFSFLKNFTYMQLYYAKFFIIAFFCLCYYAITITTIWITFKERKKIVLSSYFYIGILVIALIFYLYGLATDGSEKIYEISRTFLALLQSPLVLMILIPAFKIKFQQPIQTEN